MKINTLNRFESWEVQVGMHLDLRFQESTDKERWMNAGSPTLANNR